MTTRVGAIKIAGVDEHARLEQGEHQRLFIIAAEHAREEVVAPGRRATV